MAKRKKKTPKPEDQAISPAASPISGTPPPVEHQFQPGQSGNPSGRKSAGATIREHINSLAEQDLCIDALRLIARDTKIGWTKRAAAERILRTAEAGDLADMEDVLRGTANLKELRERGINTEVIKKIKVKKRILYGKDGEEQGEETEREVELHDRAGNDFDRIMDRTEGKPTQEVKATVNGDIAASVILSVAGVDPKD